MREVKLLKHLPWLVLFLILATGSTLWLLFVKEQQYHLQAGFQSQVERLCDELLRGRLEGRLAQDGLPDGVSTFAVYGPRGALVEAWGQNAPERIEARSDMMLRSGFLSHGNGWIEYLKVLEPLRPRVLFGDDDDQPARKMPMAARRSQGFLYLKVSESPLEGRTIAWTMAGALGTAAWAGFVVFVGMLWLRTRRYQAALSQHRELLQFAEASRTLGHELQNPLAAILLQTALLKRSSGAEVPSEVAIIEEEAQRISGLVARVREGPPRPGRTRRPGGPGHHPSRSVCGSCGRGSRRAGPLWCEV
jgi:signal transduction histidine kinase